MKFDIITLFPDIFDSYINESMIKRAQEGHHIDIRTHDLREYTPDRKHRQADDRPFGGGPGMVLMVEPIYNAVGSILKGRRTPARSAKVLPLLRDLKKNTRERTRIVLFSAKGKQFTQRDARRYQRYYDRLIFICGRYEGVDERVAQHIADEELSVGPYILTGGELPALVVLDAVTRQVPGVLGKSESLEETRSLASDHLVETRAQTPRVASYPVYTRPEVFAPPGTRGWRVPKVLLTGDHKKINAWRKNAMEQ